MYSTADGTLTVESVSTTAGADSLGAFNKTSFNWATTSGVPLVTAIRQVRTSRLSRFRQHAQYTSGAAAVVFEQGFPAGANGTSMGPTQTSMNQVMSSWPAFNVQQEQVPLGFLGYSGQMVGWNTYQGACGAV